MSTKQPEIVVFAGPNGSGKSTMTALLRPPYDYVNADEIKATLNCTDLEAAQKADALRCSHLKAMHDFSFETVLSTERNLNLLKDAKCSGYFIKCFYILTADPMINVARVGMRVISGGHDVPRDKIISRYHKSLHLIPELVKTCDICHIYDNSIDPYRIFKKRKNQCFYDEEEDLWTRESILNLTGLGDAILRNLNI